MPRIEKGRRTKAARPSPAKGLPETAPGRRPFRGAASDACFLEYKSRSSVWRFSDEAVPDATRVVQVVGNGRMTAFFFILLPILRAAGIPALAGSSLQCTTTGREGNPPRNTLAGLKLSRETKMAPAKAPTSRPRSCSARLPGR